MFLLTGPEKSDPASVVFDGMERAIAENIDVLMIDTAGRLQTRTTSWQSLKKSAHYQACGTWCHAWNLAGPRCINRSKNALVI